MTLGDITALLRAPQSSRDPTGRRKEKRSPERSVRVLPGKVCGHLRILAHGCKATDKAFSSALRPRLLLEVKQANMDLIHQSLEGVPQASLHTQTLVTTDHFSQGTCQCLGGSLSGVVRKGRLLVSWLSSSSDVK